jgi:hypothetical protein
MPVAHTCNPSYSEGRDQEDRSSKPAQANSSTRPYLEKSFTKIGLVKALSSAKIIFLAISYFLKL